MAERHQVDVQIVDDDQEDIGPVGCGGGRWQRHAQEQSEDGQLKEKFLHWDFTVSVGFLFSKIILACKPDDAAAAVCHSLFGTFMFATISSPNPWVTKRTEAGQEDTELLLCKTNLPCSVTSVFPLCALCPNK